MKTVKQIKYKDYTWEIILNKNEISFYFIKYEKYKNDDYVSKWDIEDYSDIKKYLSIESGLTKNTDIFKIVNVLIHGIVSILKNEKFFYFKSTTTQRNNIYTLIQPKLLDKLEGEWAYQQMKDYHYYTKK